MMHQNLSMTVKVKPADLIDALKKNKDLHAADYEKAVTVWFVDLQAKFKELNEKAAEGNREIDYRVFLPAPVNNIKLYDKYIGMFEMATDETIEITPEDYGCIVDDNWDWARQAATSNAAYSSKWAPVGAARPR